MSPSRILICLGFFVLAWFSLGEAHPPYGNEARPLTPEQARAVAACQVIIDSIQVLAADSGVSRQIDSSHGHLTLIWFAASEHPIGSGDSLLAIYGGNYDYGFVAVFDTRHPNVPLALALPLFRKNPMFDGGRIDRAGDILGDGHFEILLNYFEGMQVEAMRLCRYVSSRDLTYIGRVQSNGSKLDHFGGWFGVNCRDLDGDGIPEMIESTYGENKGDRFRIIYKWNGSAFVESRRER